MARSRKTGVARKIGITNRQLRRANKPAARKGFGAGPPHRKGVPTPKQVKPKMLGAHPAHDHTGKVHGPTGAKLTPTHAKHHSSFKPPKPPKMSKVRRNVAAIAVTAKVHNFNTFGLSHDLKKRK